MTIIINKITVFFYNELLKVEKYNSI